MWQHGSCLSARRIPALLCYAIPRHTSPHHPILYYTMLCCPTLPSFLPPHTHSHSISLSLSLALDISISKSRVSAISDWSMDQLHLIRPFICSRSFIHSHSHSRSRPHFLPSTRLDSPHHTTFVLSVLPICLLACLHHDVYSGVQKSLASDCHTYDVVMQYHHCVVC